MRWCQQTGKGSEKREILMGTAGRNRVHSQVAGRHKSILGMVGTAYSRILQPYLLRCYQEPLSFHLSLIYITDCIHMHSISYLFLIKQNFYQCL